LSKKTIKSLKEQLQSVQNARCKERIYKVDELFSEAINISRWLISKPIGTAVHLTPWDRVWQ